MALTNTILNFKRKEIGTYSVVDYTSLDLQKMRAYINSIPQDSFEYFNVVNGDRFERIALQLYGSSNYWDVLLLINDRHPLTGLPFDFDTISNLAESTILSYESIILKKPVPSKSREILYTKYEHELFVENEAQRLIKIIKPSKMADFIQTGFNIGVF